MGDVIVSDSFTDTNGTTLASHTGETGATWTKHGSSGAGTISINSNRAHSTGSTGPLYYASGVPSSVDYKVEGVFFLVTNLDDDAGICGRLATGANTYYLAAFRAAAIELFKVVAGVFTSLGSFSVTFAASETRTLRLEIRDATKKVFLDGTERISSTDNAITAAGRAGVRIFANQGTAAGRHLNTLTAELFTTSYNQTVSGALSPSATLAKLTSRALTGSESPAGALFRSTGRALAGTVTSSGAASKETGKPLGGECSPAGAVGRSISRALAGALTSAGDLARGVGRSLAGVLGLDAVLARSIARSLGGEITPSGTLGRMYAVLLAGAISATGTVSRLTSRALGGALTFAGALAGGLLFIPAKAVGAGRAVLAVARGRTEQPRGQGRAGDVPVGEGAED